MQSVPSASGCQLRRNPTPTWSTLEKPLTSHAPNTPSAPAYELFLLRFLRDLRLIPPPFSRGLRSKPPIFSFSACQRFSISAFRLFPLRFLRDLLNFALEIHWLNRKNCCEPEIGLVTVFCPLTTTGPGELVVQTGETRFVVDCRLNPA